MAIEKLTLVDVEGSIKKVNKTLIKCCESGCFHINPPPNTADSGIAAKSLKDKGVYERMIKRCRTLAEALGAELDENASYDDIDYSVSVDFKNYLDGIDAMQSELTEERMNLNSSLRSHGALYNNLVQFTDIDIDLKELLSCRYVKMRFGRMPDSSIEKLSFYKDKTFFFVPLNSDGSYTWCMYIASVTEANDIDFMFRNLGFERTLMPDYITEAYTGSQDDIGGSILEAEDKLLEQMKQENHRITEIENELKAIKEREGAKLSKVYAKLTAINSSYELRANVLAFDNRFHFSGYVPKKEAEKFRKTVGSIEDVTVTVRDADNDSAAPVKLKNNRLVRPFEMFVKMYGLPAANGIDPTPLVAVTYMLLYGMMFGDVGQGILIFIIGLLLTKFTKLGLAPIISRIGLASTAFGVLYGSVFGREDIIPPFFHIPQIYELLGYKEPPEDIFKVSAILLIAALIVGVTLILVSMIVNIAVSFRMKDYETAIFGGSGLCGFVFYTALVAGLGAQFAFGIELMAPWYVALFIILPLALIFFKEPLMHLAGGKRSTSKHTGGNIDTGLRAKLEAMNEAKGISGEKKSVGTFIIEGVIELFETCLTYITNTMSFLRIGGFILSHAGLMLVFSTIAGMFDGVGNIVVLVIGNLFVTGFEGFIVGIQVLRLEFYELFSRFFKGGGKAFSPAKINSKTV